MKPNHNQKKLLLLAVLASFAVASTEEDSAKAARPTTSIPRGNLIIADAEKGTTVQKDKLKAENTNQVMEFEGKVEDVRSENVAIIMIDEGNYAEVTFNTSVLNLEKGSVVKFDARIKSFGTGIMIKHDLVEASLKP